MNVDTDLQLELVVWHRKIIGDRRRKVEKDRLCPPSLILSEVKVTTLFVLFIGASVGLIFKGSRGRTWDSFDFRFSFTLPQIFL